MEETILDISASASVDETFALLGRAFQRRRTAEEALRGRLSLRSRHPKRELLELVLGDVSAGAESAMEIRYVRDVERAHGLPASVRQFSPPRDGHRLHDVGYVEQQSCGETVRCGDTEGLPSACRWRRPGGDLGHAYRTCMRGLWNRSLRLHVHLRE